MGLLDDIKAALLLEKPAAAVPPTPPAADPATPPADPATPPPTPPTDTLTRAEVDAMLVARDIETKAALDEIIKSFKGTGTPPIGGPAAPTDTAGDFSAWNAEVNKIKENLNRN